jgi:hypothetical protein
VRGVGALVVVLAQQLAGFSIDEMNLGAGRADDRLVLVFGHIRIVIQLVLDVKAGRRAPENEVAHSLEFDGPAMPDHDLAQGSPGPGVLAPIDRRPMSRQIPDSPAGFLESWRAILARGWQRSRAHSGGTNLKPGLSRRVFLLASAGSAICWLPLSGPCFRDATGSALRENRAADRRSHRL